MTTFSEAIVAMTGVKTSIDRVMLHKCLKLDGSTLTMADIDDFMNGRNISLNISDATKLFVYQNDIRTHIVGASGYNMCMELIRSMVLGTNGKMGFDYRVLNISNEEEDIRKSIYVASHCENALERAARIFAIAVEYNIVNQHSEAIGYLLMLYSLKQDGYTPFIPTDDQCDDMISIRRESSFSTMVDRILNDLRVFYSEV